jgi:iron complex outermembrane recepter protein
MMAKHAVISTFAVVATLATAPAFAQPVAGAATDTTDGEGSASIGVEDIVVTASKRSENVQDVAMAITALGGDALETRNVLQLTDLSRQVPALQVTTQSTASNSMYVVFMRGVGLTDAEQATRDLGVGIYLDDVYLGRAQGLTSDLAGLERVEVLRGPQGTLYGRNTIGGAVKFVTQKPTGKFGVKGSVDLANYGYFRGLTSVDLPEVANFSVRLSAIKLNRDGLVKNPGSGGDFGEIDTLGYRAAVRWRPADDVTIDYSYDRTKQDGTPLYVQRYTGSAAPLGVPVPISAKRRSVAWRGTDLKLADDFTTGGHNLIADFNIADELSIRSVTSYRTLTSNRLLDGQNAYGRASLQTGTLDMNEFSQELIFTGEFRDANLKYVAGANYYAGNGDYATQTLLGPLLPLVGGTYRPPTLADLPIAVISDFHNRSKGLYGQFTWNPDFFDQRLTLDVGGRYTWDKRANNRTRAGLPFDTLPGKVSYTSFDPSATLDIRITDDVHTYFRYATAFRAGGFSVRAAANDAGFRPEFLTSYEVGLKSQFLDNRVQLNVAAFTSKYTDIQVDGTDTSGRSHTVNAGNATIKGVEVDATVVLTEGLTLTGNYAGLWWSPDGPLVFPFTTSGPPAPLVLPNIPKTKYNVAVEYQGDVGFAKLLARADYAYVSKLAPGVTSIIPGYGLVNARLALSRIDVGTPGNLTLSIWAKNLFDKEHVIFDTFQGGAFGDPRMVGFGLSYEF